MGWNSSWDSRAAVEHVLDLKEEEHSEWVVLGYKSVHRGPGKVWHAVKASFDGYAKLGQGQEMLGNGDGESFHDVLACNMAVGDPMPMGRSLPSLSGSLWRAMK